jgi:pyruvate formate lyase activating enzyme
VDKEALLYDRLPEGKVRCTACARYCVVPEGSQGFCFVRKNIGGKLYLTVYGTAAAVQVDPIEKKPLLHYMPGRRVFGIGTVGCNWRCQYCQNYEVSQEREAWGRRLLPKEAVDWAIREQCQGITFTYNEPTIFLEYARDIMREAHARGLFTNFVTNGYMTPEAVSLLQGNLDAVSIDFKGSGEAGFLRKYISAKGSEPILETMRGLARGGTHVEITNLIVPRVGDSKEALRTLAAAVRDSLGPDTAFHLLRWHPDYLMRDLPETPVATLEALHAVAKEEGLRYVYLGNVWGHPLENTYCAGCGTLVVKRNGFYIEEWNLEPGNHCPTCGRAIPIMGELPADYRPTYVTPL